MGKVLITGSSGHSGNAIYELLKEEHEVYGIDIVAGNGTNITGNLQNWDLVKQITKGVDCIIHTASLHAPHVLTRSREEFVDINIKGTLYLLEAAKLNGVKKLIYTSTTSVYGDSMKNDEEAVWITEEVTPTPRDIYDITKLTAEELCRDFFDGDQLQTISLRVSRFWDEPMENRVFYRMYRGLDIRDVSHAHKLAMEMDLDQFEVFNISAQSIFDRKDIVDLKNNLVPLLKDRLSEIIEYYEKKGWTLPDSIDRVYSIDKAKELLGYHPKYNVKEMLEELMK